jgi:hypothetical protein
VLQGSLNSALRKRPIQPDGSVRVSKVEESAQLSSLGSSLGTLGTFEGSVARFLARKLRRISKELTATNQKLGSSNLASALSEAAARVSSARVARPLVKGNAMKKKRPADAGDLRPEYKSTTRPPSAASTTAASSGKAPTLPSWSRMWPTPSAVRRQSTSPPVSVANI